jgi:hypothetical protein
MEAGELEIKQAFEEVATRNIRTIGDYTKTTREMVREQGEKIELQAKEIRQLKDIIGELRLMLSSLQQKMYQNGS